MIDWLVATNGGVVPLINGAGAWSIDALIAR